jgi:hypothetical protein
VAKSVGRFVLGWLVLGGVAIGIATYLYREHEVELHEAEAKRGRVRHARSIVAAMVKSWDANDDWEDSLPSSSGLYTMEVEKALISGRRLLIYGMIDDVQRSGETENSVVSVQAETRVKRIDLRLSLLSAPSVTDAIMARKEDRDDVFVFAVKINSVEKISAPSDNSSGDYFVAHGVVYEARPIGLYEPPASLSSQSD